MRKILCVWGSAVVLLGSAAVLSAQGFATTVLVHGRVWTVDAGHPEAEAVAIDGDRIAAVGSTEEISKRIGPRTHVIDVQGRRVLPGFNDAHVHFYDGSASLSAIDATHTKSPAEFREMVAPFTAKVPKGAWITDGNWDHENWTPAKLPTHELLDPVTPDNPAALFRLDGHMVLANTLAMRLAGVDRNTKDVPGGEIDRDAQGNPTGIFRDAAMGLILRHIPLPTVEQVEKTMGQGLRYAAEHGVTSVQEMADNPGSSLAPSLHAYQRLLRKGGLTIRVSLYPSLTDGWQHEQALGIEAGFGNSILRLGGLKGFADGSLGSTTAWMFHPYDDAPQTSGIASSELQDAAKMYAAIRDADRARIQPAIHAIGDRANHTVLDIYSRLEQENPEWDRRLRIEHAQHLSPEDIARFGALHVIASMQPYHCIDDGRFAEKRLGSERIKTSYAWRSILDSGGRLAFGSDWPVAPMDPLLGIYAATTRRTLDGKNPKGWIPEQKITVAEAIRAYTLDSAYAEYQEKEKGSIEPGKLADLVVLSDDILHEDPVLLAKAQVVMTIFNGDVVFNREASSSQ